MDLRCILLKIDAFQNVGSIENSPENGMTKQPNKQKRSKANFSLVVLNVDY